MKNYLLKELAEFLGAELRGNAEAVISMIAPLATANEGQITFLEKTKYRELLSHSKASAVILRAEDLRALEDNHPQSLNFLVVNNPYLAYAKISALFCSANENVSGMHPTVICGKNCVIDITASIAPYCVIGNNVVIGADVNIGVGTFIGNDVKLGAATRIYPRVTMYDAVQVGKRCVVHSGAVIGSDGFGMANDNGKWCKIYQLGSVVIGDDVEIGANTTIDRGALDDTLISDGTKLDNQIQIGHNVQIGAHTAIAGCTGIAGSTKIGKHCMIGGGVGINGHINICDGVIIAAMTGVEQSIQEPGMYASCVPAMPHRVWWRILTRLTQLDTFMKRMLQLKNVQKGRDRF